MRTFVAYDVLIPAVRFSRVERVLLYTPATYPGQQAVLAVGSASCIAHSYVLLQTTVVQQ